jgi:hypothetical protein
VNDVSFKQDHETDFVPWLRMLAANGGKGVVNNIDARCLGRIADQIESLRGQRDEAEQRGRDIGRAVGWDAAKRDTSSTLEANLTASKREGGA